MPNEKFTPGNWVALSGHKVWDESEKVINICQEEGAPYTQFSSDVCELVISHDNPDVVRANASLIAAAPEMYQLLQKFIPMDEDGNGSFVYEDGSECMGEDVNKLLAKARGEDV